MGQRLVINLYLDDERVACVYKHWSAYTRSTLQCALEYAEAFRGITQRRDWGAEPPNEDDVLRAVFVAWPLAGMVEEDFDRGLLERLGFRRCAPYVPISTDRNEGLVAVSEAQMDDLMAWAEGRLDVMISTEDGSLLFYTDVYWTTGSEEDVEEASEIPYGELSKELQAIVSKLEWNIGLDEGEVRRLLEACCAVWGDSFSFRYEDEEGRAKAFQLVA